MKRLIVNADDYGYSVERNKGIEDCYLNRSISASSLLINGVAVTDAIDRAKKIGLHVGLHLNITEGSPVSDISDVTTLVGLDNLFLGKYLFRDALRQNQIDKRQVETEINAQIKRFHELTGNLPINVDGHHHFHVLPGICDIFASNLRKNGIRYTRIPIERGIERCYWVDDARLRFYEKVVADAEAARCVFTSHGISSADSFIGLSCTGRDMTYERCRERIFEIFGNTSSSDHSCEFMVHPGYKTGDEGGCGDGPDWFSQSSDREHELRVLRQLSANCLNSQLGIKMSNWLDI